MKNTIFTLMLLIPILGLSQGIKLDTDDASVSFVFEADKTKGTIAGITASIVLKPTDLGSSVIKGSALIGSLDTGNKGRDKHLKSKDFFDAEKYPTMSFTSSKIVKEGDDYKASGTLTIKDVTKDVSFTMKMEGKNMVFETTIYSSDFNIAAKKGREKNKVTVKVTVPISK
ncbi:MAG: YceI family protein [Crocinitomicaceae bacterium]|nr:YceI family protein [Crocinitomicaceae bacterium]